MLSSQVVELLEDYKKQLHLNDQNDQDLLDEIISRLKRVIKRNQEIEELYKEVALERSSEILSDPEVEKCILGYLGNTFY